MSWTEPALWWLPTFAVAAMTAVALAAALAVPRTPRARRLRTAAILVCGIGAIAASAWQQHRSRAEFGGEAAELRALGAELDAIGRVLPQGAGPAPRATFDSVSAAIGSLRAQIRQLESQIEALREKSLGRALTARSAAALADYLRPFGSRRVVVSCVPDDVESYGYANQIASVLRAAGWDAAGPETTTIFGRAPAMGLSLYVPGGQPPDTARILVEAFAKFNIPYKGAIAPSEAIPDTTTVELFVAPKP